MWGPWESIAMIKCGDPRRRLWGLANGTERNEAAALYITPPALGRQAARRYAVSSALKGRRSLCLIRWT